MVEAVEEAITAIEIINGGVGNDKTIPGYKSQFHSKISKQSPIRNNNCDSKELGEVIHVALNRVVVDFNLLNQKKNAVLEGISKEAYSVPNAVAPQEITENGATAPPYTKKLKYGSQIHSNDHVLAYNKATDVKDLDIDQRKHLKYLLLQENGNFDQYLIDKEEQLTDLENNNSVYTPMNLVRYLRN